MPLKKPLVEILKMDQDDDDLTKISVLSSALLMFHKELTEEELRGYITILNLDLIDPDIYATMRHYVNLLHYSGAITVTERMEDSLLDNSSEGAFEGLTSEWVAKWREGLEEGARYMLGG